MFAQMETGAAGLRIALSGRLTFAENGEFRRIVTAVAGQGDEVVVFDMTALDYIDSAGMGMLLVVRDELAARGGRVVLRGPDGQVGRMLELARFSDFFTIQH